VSDPPIDDWARQHALLEVCRIARELPNPDFERDVQPRLGRLTPGQRAILEAGVLLLLEAEEPWGINRGDPAGT
jgi:hypothetical protein